MSSYHDSFTYKNKNSLKDMNLIITSFEPDEGFTETFLSMDPIFENNFDGTRQYSYGAKYNSKANINITLVKKDYTEFSMAEFRECARWLTGSRVDSWMDMYVGSQIVYCFLGKITDLQQYKLDGRTIGIQAIFSSVTPWAFSEEQYYDCHFGQELRTNSNVLYMKDYENSPLNVDKNGILYAGHDVHSCFSWMDEDVYDGIIAIDNTVTVLIDNQTDDLYTYINLNTKFINDNSDFISIKNTYTYEDTITGEVVQTTDETKVIGMSNNENILLSSEQFITSDTPNKIFGNNFNFVWPKLAPGINTLLISGSGTGNVQFTFRYPMKIGDSTIDIDKSNPRCIDILE